MPPTITGSARISRLNLIAAPLGYRLVDPTPFSWLGGAVSLVSLYMVVLILVTQQRDDLLPQGSVLVIRMELVPLRA
jgi:hypothetical protein